jgi:type IV secretion system protein VirB10
VQGERDVPIVHRARSLQSRLSSLLAAALMIALGLSLLAWYYTSALARQARAWETARARTASRAQGEMPLPPLGKAVLLTAPAAASMPESPEVSAERSHTGAPAGSLPSLDSPLASPRPGNMTASEALLTAPAAGSVPQAKTLAQRALNRRLSGAVFARESQAGLLGMPGASLAPASAGAASGIAALAAAGSEARRGASGDWEQLLKAAATPAVQAQLLPTQRFLLPKGAFIDCTLETAIDSDLPGLTSCVTAIDTFGVDGKVVLLGRGTKLIGETRGQMQHGMSRVFVLWTQARTPEGVVVSLDSPGTDELGRAGLPGAVDRHFWDRFGAAVLVSLIDGAVQAGVQSEDRGGGTVIYNPSTSQGVLTEVLKGTIDIPPTVVKRNGDRIEAMVARDLDFRPVYELRSRR